MKQKYMKQNKKLLKRIITKPPHCCKAITGDDVKQSYDYFKKADKWVSGYKDVRGKMDEAYQNATIDVLINPVHDNSFYFNSSWGNAGYNYSNEYFQQNLVRDLGGKYSSRYPARFYTEWESPA